jgi:hypothetical protein
VDFVSVLTKCIENVNVISEKEIFEKLRDVELSKLSTELALFIQAVTNKSSDKSNLAKFVSFMIEETVPSWFADSAIALVFNCAVLIRHLQNPEKCENALFMIKRAVQKEADFFRVGRETGPTILFHLSGVEELEN